MADKNQHVDVGEVMSWDDEITVDGSPQTEAKSTDGTGLDLSGFESLTKVEGTEQEQAETERYINTGPKKFSAIPMSELMGGDYTVEYLCNGVLAKDQPAVMGGPQKAFKTSIALELAVCVATGEKYLDHFSVPRPVKVCFFTGEGGLGVIQDTLRRIGEARGIDISKIKNLLVTDEVPRLDDPKHLLALEKYLKEHEPEVCFFDPLYLAMGAAEVQNVFSMGERLGELNRVCLPLGCTPVLLHHLRKTRVDRYKPAGLEDLSMSGIAEFAGQWILLSRRSEYNPDDPTHRLWVHFGGRTGHGSAWGLNIHEGTNEGKGGRIWDIELKRQDEVRAEVTDAKAEKQEAKKQAEQAKFDADCESVLKWIREHPGGVTMQQVKDSRRCPVSKAGAVLLHLVDVGAIEQCEVNISNGTATRKNLGYKAISSSSENLLNLDPDDPDT